MGIVRSGFTFITGAVFGVYVAQNYAVPDIVQLAKTGIATAKGLVETYRKPPKKSVDDE